VWPGSWFACAACAAKGVAAGANESERRSSAALSAAISTLVMTVLPDTANAMSPPSKMAGGNPALHVDPTPVLSGSQQDSDEPARKASGPGVSPEAAGT
jgi:hypothetical protein